MRKNLILIFLLAWAIPSQASHIVGGEIWYDYLGGNNYRFYIALYRDCASTGAAYDSPLPLSVFTGTGIRISDENVAFPGSTVLPIVFNNPCITAPTGICTERAIYTRIPTTYSPRLFASTKSCPVTGSIVVVDPGPSGTA